MTSCAVPKFSLGDLPTSSYWTRPAGPTTDRFPSRSFHSRYSEAADQV